MSKADFLSDSLQYKEFEFNGAKALLKEFDGQEYAAILDVIQQSFSKEVSAKNALDIRFKAFAIAIALHDENKERVFNPDDVADLEAITKVNHNIIQNAYVEIMRFSNLHGFIGEEPPKKPEA